MIIAFPPILPENPHTLILGTMPGGKSLERKQYYAHPQNQFWKFMGDIYGAGPNLPYEERIRILKGQGVAVWDVLYACTRQGSMDANIKNGIVNNFEEFYQQNPNISLVVFDSLTAEKIYKKQVMPTLSKKLEYKRVPSPSPAHARLPYAAKLALWSNALQNYPTE
jgi:TDG/mug DNA glycosylase family protein